MMNSMMKGALLFISLLYASVTWGNCNKISSPWNDYPMTFNFGASLYIDPALPVGTIIAQQIVSSDSLAAVNGGWFAVCDNALDAIKYWWLEQHYSSSANNGPVSGVTAPTTDHNVYVMQDNGNNNPYGGNGSGSIGYSTELITSSNNYPFAWLSTAPNKNLPPLSTGPVRGVTCALAKNGLSGYPAFTGNCNLGQFVVNWRQLPQFTIKVTLYRLKGTIPAQGLTMTNNNGEGFSLFSVMDNTSTPPGWNTNTFNLVRLRLANDVKVQTSPCQAFGTVNVNLGSVNASSFAKPGQPASGVPDTPVHISAKCAPNTAMKWALLGTTSSYNPDGTQGILQLDPATNSASGVGVQLVNMAGTPLLITPSSSTNYKWIDTNLISSGAGMLSIDFLARYLRVGTVTPGVANAHAYLVISPK